MARLRFIIIAVLVVVVQFSLATTVQSGSSHKIKRSSLNLVKKFLSEVFAEQRSQKNADDRQRASDPCRLDEANPCFAALQQTVADLAAVHNPNEEIMTRICHDMFDAFDCIEEKGCGELLKNTMSNIIQQAEIICKNFPRQSSVHSSVCAGFKCRNDRCVPANYKCDGDNDCGDRSDELNCPCHGFRCTSGECVPLSYKCDHSDDCQDGSDEKGCVCPGFQCLDGTACLPAPFRCDGDSDCTDNSDEAGCS